MSLQCKGAVSPSDVNILMKSVDLIMGGKVGDLLKELPSFNQTNFSRFCTDGAPKPWNRRPAVYIPTKEISPEAEQVIVTDKTNILLRFLHQKQFEAKVPGKKRDTVTADFSQDPEHHQSRKVPRMESDDSVPD